MFFHLRFWSHDPNYLRTQANLEIITGLQVGDIAVVLRGLRAVVAVKRAEELEMPDDYPLQEFIRYYSPTISVHHHSFVEFLTEEARSGTFFVDTNATQQETIDRLYSLIIECLSQRYNFTFHFVETATLGPMHLVNRPDDIPSIHPHGRLWNRS